MFRGSSCLLVQRRGIEVLELGGDRSGGEGVEGCEGGGKTGAVEDGREKTGE